MKGEKIVFVCRECGYTHPKWLGKCPDCQSWNSFDEEAVVEKTIKSTLNRQDDEQPQIFRSRKPPAAFRGSFPCGKPAKGQEAK